MQDIDIRVLLKSLGYDGEAFELARRALEEAGLTRPGKSRIATTKVLTVKKALLDQFIRVCSRPRCRAMTTSSQAANNHRRLVAVEHRHCEVCGGSDNRRAVHAMAQAMRRTGKMHLLVVGGTPEIRKGLQALLEPPCEVKFVLGDGRASAKDAAQKGAWAHLVVIWASTPIPHKVTALYKDYGPIMVARRSITALAEAVSQACESP